jgi:hypothetical protein
MSVARDTHYLAVFDSLYPIIGEINIINFIWGEAFAKPTLKKLRSLLAKFQKQRILKELHIGMPDHIIAWLHRIEKISFEPTIQMVEHPNDPVTIVHTDCKIAYTFLRKNGKLIISRILEFTFDSVLDWKNFTENVKVTHILLNIPFVLKSSTRFHQIFNPDSLNAIPRMKPQKKAYLLPVLGFNNKISMLFDDNKRYSDNIISKVSHMFSRNTFSSVNLVDSNEVSDIVEQKSAVYATHLIMPDRFADRLAKYIFSELIHSGIYNLSC